MKYLKLTIIAVLLALILIALVIGLVLENKKADRLYDQIGALNEQIRLSENKKIEIAQLGAAIYLRNTFFNGITATSSATHILDGQATSSLTFDSSAADLISIDFNINSTTTPVTVFYLKEFSLNGIDYFPEIGKTINSVGSVTVGTGPVIYTWTYATTTKTVGTAIRFDDSIDPIGSHKTRVRFWTSGADSEIWLKATVRERR